MVQQIDSVSALLSVMLSVMLWAIENDPAEYR